MLRTRWLGVGVLALALGLMLVAAPSFVWAASPADGPESALAIVPADAPFVVQIHGVQRTKDRLMAMIRKAVPDLAPALESKIDEGMKQVAEGRDLKGLAKDGPIFLVLTEMPKQGGLPAMAVIVKATKYAEFRDTILTEDERKTLKATSDGYDMATIKGQDHYLVNHKGYAVITPQKEVAAQFTKDYKGLGGKLSQPLARKLLESDIGLYIDMGAINKEYGPQIQLGRQLLEGMLQQQGGGFGGLQGNPELLKKIFGNLFQAIEDSRALLFTFEFRPEGLAIHGQDQVGAETQTNLMLKDLKPASLAGLDQQISGKTAYSAFHLDEPMVKALTSILFGVQVGDDKENKEVREALGEIIAAKPSERLDAFSFPMQGLQVGKFQDPNKAAAGVLKLLQALKGGETFMSAAFKDKPEVKPDAQKHRGFTLHHFSGQWDLDKMVENSLKNNPLGEGMKKPMTEMMKQLMGEGIKSWFGSDGKRFVQVIAPDWNTAKSQLDDFLDGKNPVGKEPAFQEARKQLPAEATVLGFIDVPPYFQIMGSFAQSMMQALGNQQNLPEPKPMKGVHAYLGFAGTLQSERASFDVWFPGSAANAIHKMYTGAKKE